MRVAGVLDLGRSSLPACVGWPWHLGTRAFSREGWGALSFRVEVAPFPCRSAGGGVM